MPSTKRRAPPLDPVEARNAMLRAIAAAEAPVSIKELGSLAELPRKATGPQVKSTLAEDVASGRVFKWGASNFWDRDGESVARARLLEISAACFPTRSELSRRAADGAPKITSGTVKTALAALIEERRLKELPGKRVINARHPEAYLESAIANLFASIGFTRTQEKIRTFLGASPQTELKAEPQDDPVQDAAEKLFAAMNRIAFSPGATVTFYRLRQQPELANIPKEIFDRAALLLQSERRALLSIHDHATRLPGEERDALVTDGLGKYYVSIYAR